MGNNWMGSVEPVTKKTVTLLEIADAIEQNGLPRHKTDFFMVNEDGDIIAACALGQAAINLNIEANNLYGQMEDMEDMDLGDLIAGLSDLDDSFKDIANYVRLIAKEYNNPTFTVVEKTYSVLRK